MTTGASGSSRLQPACGALGRPSVLALVLVVTALCGCGTPDGTTLPRTRLVERWVSPEDLDRYDPADGLERRETQSWLFTTREDLEGWRFEEKTTTPKVSLKGVGLRLVEGRHRLERRVDLAASTLDLLEIALSGPMRGKIRVFWTRESEPYSRERMVQVEVRQSASDTWEVELHRQPLWKGNIRRLRFDFVAYEPDAIILAGIRGIALGVPSSPAEGKPKAWRVNHGHEVRNALLMQPGQSVEKVFDLPLNSALEFGWGVASSVETDVELVVEADGAELFRVAVGDDPDSIERWRDTSIDLAHLGAGSKRFVLSIESRSEPGSRVPVYIADPKLVERGSTKPSGPSVLLIIIDTLRADRLSINGYARPTSPSIDSWFGRHGVNFPKTIATAPWTIPSHISIFTGMGSLEHGLNFDQALPPSATTVAESLQRTGYSTLAVTGGVYLHPRYGLDQGFDRFVYWPSDQPQQEEMKAGVDAVLDLLPRLVERPSFLLFHTYETHSPFHPREPWYGDFTQGSGDVANPIRIVSRRAESGFEQGFLGKKMLVAREPEGAERPPTAGEIEDLNARYDSGVGYADEQVGRLLARLDELDPDRKILVILTSDHGEALGEMGLGSHAYLNEFNLKVPLLIALPEGRFGGKAIDRQVRTTDITPTLLEVVGLASSHEIEGRSLLPLLEDPTVPFPNEAWSYAASSGYGLSLRLANEIKYHYNNSLWPALQGQEQLYRLRGDPQELEDLAGEASPAEIRRLRERMASHFSSRGAGLKVLVANGDLETLSVEISRVKPRKLKAVNLPEGVSVRFERPGRTLLEVPGGVMFELSIEALGAKQEVRFKLGPVGAPETCVVNTTPEAMTVPHGLSFIPPSPGCELKPIPKDAASPTTGLLIHYLGGVAGARTTQIDPDLTEKLRALGYLE